MSSPEPSEKKKEKKRKTRKKHQDERQPKKPKYSPSKWDTSSSESENESLYHRNELVVGNLPRNATRNSVMKFFNGKPDDANARDLLNQKGEFVDRQGVARFHSRSDTKEGLALNGKKFGGRTIYVTRNGNSREIMCVSGFNNQVAVDDIKEELSRVFSQRGELLNIFLPVDSITGSSLGFGYIYIDLMEKSYKDLIQSTEIGGVQVNIREAKPKLYYRAEMEGTQQPVLIEGSDEEKKFTLKKKLLPIPPNLHNLVANQRRFSWRKDKPNLIPETRKQLASECWAIGLHKGLLASAKQAGKKEPVPTIEEIVKGVDAAYQASGEGIRRLKYALPFMQNHCKEMLVYRRPRGDDVALFEDFERLLIDVSTKVPVMVTVECVPGFVQFNGQGMYRPNDIDCYLRTFEKFPIHCLFLTGNDIDENGIEFWQLQETSGKEYGDDEGFIKMERHKCLIKSVVVFKH
ncbi:unnamed protein product [Eruca vesicaria subsp. sativa]|uniref:RRM domain-containing protein n=1 Tax=Eruca vesicaria subsp. sativa TaxID=29727 RepID=A0ABC8JUE5_ERUVS|nr:unnamed protein product [Eruca vesicaria subsp. sativa]